MLSERDVLLDKSRRILPALSNDELKKFIADYNFVFDNKTEDLPVEVKFTIMKHIDNFQDLFKVLMLNKSWYALCKPSDKNDKFWISMIIKNNESMKIPLRINCLNILMVQYNTFFENKITYFELYLFSLWIKSPRFTVSIHDIKLYLETAIRTTNNYKNPEKSFMNDPFTRYMLFNVAKNNNIRSLKRKRKKLSHTKVSSVQKLRWFYSAEYNWFQYFIFNRNREIDNMCLTEKEWSMIIRKWVDKNTYYDTKLQKYRILLKKLQSRNCKIYSFLKISLNSYKEPLYNSRDNIVRKIMDIYLIKLGSLKIQ